MFIFFCGFELETCYEIQSRRVGYLNDSRLVLFCLDPGIKDPVQ